MTAWPHLACVEFAANSHLQRGYLLALLDKHLPLPPSNAESRRLRWPRTAMDLSVARDTSCRDVDAVVRNHLAQVEEKQKELAAMAEDLRAMLDDCAHETIANCNVVRTLSG